MKTRRYGTSGPPVAVLHGGPGAPGYMAPVARRLGTLFRVLEPFQRGSGAEPLTVARHVEDLRELLRSRFGGARTALVGHSWGAMLALAFGAARPEDVASLVLIGCGTFDLQSRRHLEKTRHERMDKALQRRMQRLETEFPDPDRRLRTMVQLLLPVDSCDLLPTALELESCDARAFQETWEDMMRRQRSGEYPAAFSAIGAPVLMLHGAHDPHPGRLIEASLKPHLPQLEYREFKRCGHYPWLEKAVGEEIFAVLIEWLGRQF